MCTYSFGDDQRSIGKYRRCTFCMRGYLYMFILLLLCLRDFICMLLLLFFVGGLRVERRSSGNPVFYFSVGPLHQYFMLGFLVQFCPVFCLFVCFYFYDFHSCFYAFISMLLSAFAGVACFTEPDLLEGGLNASDW